MTILLKIEVEDRVAEEFSESWSMEYEDDISPEEATKEFVRTTLEEMISNCVLNELPEEGWLKVSIEEQATA